jgi:guanylate kinase
VGVYIIVGASGCGKQFIVDKVVAMLTKATEVKKYTTRKKPDEQHIKNDLHYGCRQTDIHKNCGLLIYEYENELYGIVRNEIDTVLSEGGDAVLIVRDYRVLIELKKIYPFAITIYVRTNLTGYDLEKRLSELGVEDDLSSSDRTERERKASYEKSIGISRNL